MLTKAYGMCFLVLYKFLLLLTSVHSQCPTLATPNFRMSRSRENELPDSFTDTAAGNSACNGTLCRKMGLTNATNKRLLGG